MSLPEEETATNSANPRVTSSDQKLSLDVLSTILPQQNVHGIRHGQYRRYREYCSAKLRRLRRLLRMTNGKKFSKRTVTPDNARTVKHLMIPLFMAERCWAIAMEMKELMISSAEEKSRKKFHMLSRFRKASVNAAYFHKLCEAVGDTRTALDAEAYSSWMQGQVKLEREEYADSLQCLARTSAIYSQFATVSSPAHRILLNERLSQIEPSINYCNVRIGGQMKDVKTLVALQMQATGPEFDMLNAKLEGIINEARKTQSNTLLEIELNGKVIQVKSESIRVKLLQAQEKAFELDSSKDKYFDVNNSESSSAKSFDAILQLYDGLLLAYSEVNDSIRNEKTLLNKGGADKKSMKNEITETNLDDLLKYIQWHKLERCIERDSLRVQNMDHGPANTNTAPQAKGLVRIYETLIQYISELDSLCGEDQIEQKKLISAKQHYFKAFRCYYVSHAYAEQNQTKEAIALLDRCNKRIADAIEHYLACKSNNETSIKSLRLLEQKLAGKRSAYAAQQYLRTADADASRSTNVLSENYDGFDMSVVNENRVSNIPPSFSAVVCKPILYDLASSSCEFPDISSRLAPKKTSLWGFWRS